MVSAASSREKSNIKGAAKLLNETPALPSTFDRSMLVKMGVCKSLVEEPSFSWTGTDVFRL